MHSCSNWKSGEVDSFHLRYLLTYLDLTNYIVLIFERIKKAHEVLDRLDLEPAKVCLCFKSGKTRYSIKLLFN